MAVSSVKDEEARAVIGDVMARIPEHRDQALHDLQQLTADPKDNEAAHRGLARDIFAQKKFDAAADELEKATELNPRDPWIWYYRSALKYQKAQATRQEMQGLANMMQDLRAVADWYPDLADAYNMLGMARVEGGGINSALEAQRQAIALAPRNVEYQFNLGQIYVAGKKWDLAREVFTRLKAGPDRRQQRRRSSNWTIWRRCRSMGCVRSGRGKAQRRRARPALLRRGRVRLQRRRAATEDDEDADAAPKPAPVEAGNDRAGAISERQDREQ